MTTFKVRNNILAAGGITIPSGATMTNSGSVQNSGSTIIGASGTSLTNLLAGTVSACMIAMANGASAAGSAAITGVAAGDLIFITGACLSGSAFITSASVTTTNTVRFTAYNSSSGTSGASTVLLQYLAVRT